MKTNYHQRHEFSSVKSVIEAGLPENRIVTVSNAYLIPARFGEGILVDTNVSYKTAFFSYIDSSLKRIRLLRSFFVEKKPLSDSERDTLVYWNQSLSFLLKKHDKKYLKENDDLVQMLFKVAACKQMLDIKKSNPEFVKEHRDSFQALINGAGYQRMIDTMQDKDLVLRSIQREAGLLKDRVEEYTNSIVESPCVIAANSTRRTGALSVDTADLGGIDDVIGRVRQSANAYAKAAFSPVTVTGRIYKENGNWVRIDCNPERMYRPRALLASMCATGGGLLVLVVMLITGIFQAVRSIIIFKRIKKLNAFVKILPEKKL